MLTRLIRTFLDDSAYPVGSPFPGDAWQMHLFARQACRVTNSFLQLRYWDLWTLIDGQTEDIRARVVADYVEIELGAHEVGGV